MTTIWGPGPTEYRFFWHSELEHFASGERAQGYLKSLKKDTGTIQGLEHLLDTTSRTTLGEDEIAALLAEKLVHRELIANRMLSESLQPLWRHDVRFLDRSFALQYLTRFRRDPIAIARLRAILAELGLGARLSLASVNEVFAAIANLLAIERLVPGFRLYAKAGAAIEEELTAAPLRAPSSVAATPASPKARETDEAPTFADNDGAAQAAALRAAALTGVPFCEECAKAAAAQLAAQQV